MVWRLSDCQAEKPDFEPCLSIGVWTKLVPDRWSMRVVDGPRPGGRLDARRVGADFSSSSATDCVQPDSTKTLLAGWHRAPALLVGMPGRPSTDAPTANILSKLELVSEVRESPTAVA